MASEDLGTWDQSQIDPSAGLYPQNNPLAFVQPRPVPGTAPVLLGAAPAPPQVVNPDIKVTPATSNVPIASSGGGAVNPLAIAQHSQAIQSQATANGDSLGGLTPLLNSALAARSQNALGASPAAAATPAAPAPFISPPAGGYSPDNAGSYAPLLQSAAAKYNLDPKLFTRQIYRESAFDPRSHSPAGAQGIAQFMPGTAARYKVDVTDPASSIEGSAHYMSDLMKMFNGNVGLATAAYNWGEGNLQHYLQRGDRPVPKETKDYVQFITGKPFDEWVKGAGGAGKSQGAGGQQQQQQQQGAAPAASTVSATATGDDDRQKNLMKILLMNQLFGQTFKFHPVEYNPWEIHRFGQSGGF